MKLNFDGKSVNYLHPGEVIFSKKPIIVSTILGSCLSITMFCKSKQFAGISHCQLPKCKEQDNVCNKCKEPFKYVDCSIKKMLKKFEQNKIETRDIEIKIFGAADVLNNSNNMKVHSIGKQNIIAIKKIVCEYKLNIAAIDIGGEHGRKIFFNSSTGDVYLHRMKPNEKN